MFRVLKLGCPNIFFNFSFRTYLIDQTYLKALQYSRCIENPLKLSFSVQLVNDFLAVNFFLWKNFIVEARLGSGLVYFSYVFYLSYVFSFIYMWTFCKFCLLQHCCSTYTRRSHWFHIQIIFFSWFYLIIVTSLPKCEHPNRSYQ